jgi:hypothetical protein
MDGELQAGDSGKLLASRADHTFQPGAYCWVLRCFLMVYRTCERSTFMCSWDTESSCL